MLGVASLGILWDTKKKKKKIFDSYVNNNTCDDFGWEKTVKHINCAAGRKVNCRLSGTRKEFSLWQDYWIIISSMTVFFL